MASVTPIVISIYYAAEEVEETGQLKPSNIANSSYHVTSVGFKTLSAVSKGYVSRPTYISKAFVSMPST